MPRAEQWADQIRAELARTIEPIVEVGRLLLKAKSDLAHGEWGRMFDDGLIPLSQRTANCYMAIATNQLIANSHHGANLPPSWRTLYELACLPEPTLKRALKDGLITPETERKHVKALMPSKAGANGSGRRVAANEASDAAEIADDEEPPPTAVEYEDAFLLRADAAKTMAEMEYRGPVTDAVRRAARCVVSAWTKRAEILEGK